MQIFVETERLIMREIVPDDEHGFFEMDSDSEVHRYLGNKPVKSIEEIRKAIAFIRQQYVDNGIGRWAVIEKQTGNFIGWSGLKLVKDEFNGKTDFYDLGYRFNKRYWGKGYATETAKASVQYGFETMKLRKITGMAHIDNIASQNVLQKAGLKFVNTFDYEDFQKRWYEMDNPSLK
jgi:[ribosomal protein S5]-alanine N-acetyltransferase